MKLTLLQRSLIITAACEAFTNNSRMSWSKPLLKSFAGTAELKTGIKAGTFEVSIYKMTNLMFEEKHNISIKGIHNGCAKWMRIAAKQLVEEGSV